MKSLITLIVAGSFLLLPGCSIFEDEEEDAYEPAPLPDIEEQFHVSPNWSSDVGGGVYEFYNKLGPVAYSGMVYAADIEGLVKAFSIDDGDEIWSVELETELYGGVAAGSGLIAVGSTEGEVIVLDAKTGEEKWRNLVSSEIVASPAISDNRVVTRTIHGK
ncbi:MAG: hypothetical protein DRQ47_01350 [Gammaproteobacteria bacterium]|nr:MAG: hypothetical protein DRQ47_01350 [Gammaproteobacteria bacterium]